MLLKTHKIDSRLNRLLGGWKMFSLAPEKRFSQPDTKSERPFRLDCHVTSFLPGCEPCK